MCFVVVLNVILFVCVCCVICISFVSFSWFLGICLYSEVVDSFVTPEPHPDTIELARKLIDEIQTAQKSTSHASKLPPVPAFKESANQRKPTEEMFGSSDSESVSDFDYRNVGGGDSDICRGGTRSRGHVHK